MERGRCGGAKTRPANPAGENVMRRERHGGWWTKGEESGEDRSCRRHLGGHSPLALQLRLVLLKRLLPTALEILAVVMLGHPVL